jgi:hypothetical protein
MAYGNGLFVGIPDYDGQSPSLLTSPDAVTWIRQQMSTAGQMRSIVFAGEVFVGAANGNDGNSFELWTSADTTNWSRTYSLTNAGFRTSYAGPDGFHVWGVTSDVVSVDLTYEMSAHLTSINGRDWLLITTPQDDNGGLVGPPNRPNVVFANGTFVAASWGAWSGEGLYTLYC